MKIEIEFEDGYSYETKVNGQTIVWHPEKMHNTWLVKFLEKGLQRFANDKYSGEDPNTKLDLIRALAADAHSGNECPERTIYRRASLPEDQTLAIKNAKQDLTLVFKKITGMVKISDMANHEKVAPFFNEGKAGPVWNDEAVQAWIEKRKESGKDYLAEAQASLAVMDEAEDLL